MKVRIETHTQSSHFVTLRILERLIGLLLGVLGDRKCCLFEIEPLVRVSLEEKLAPAALAPISKSEERLL